MLHFIYSKESKQKPFQKACKRRRSEAKHETNYLSTDLTTFI